MSCRLVIRGAVLGTQKDIGFGFIIRCSMMCVRVCVLCFLGLVWSGMIGACLDAQIQTKRREGVRGEELVDAGQGVK